MYIIHINVQPVIYVLPLKILSYIWVSVTTSEFLRTPSPESINLNEFPKPPSLTNSGNLKEKTADLLPLSLPVTFLMSYCRC